EYRLTIPTIDNDYLGVTSIQIAPDGQAIYFVASNPERKRVLFRRGLNDFRAVPIEANTLGFSFVITPDGRNLILQMSGGILKRISVDGGAAVPAGVVEAGIAEPGPDGLILAGSSNLDLPIRRVTVDRVEPILALDKAHGEVGQIYPTFLPARKR